MISIRDSDSLYLLEKNSSKSSFWRYHKLMTECAEQGEFLFYKNHLEWLSCYEKDAQSIQNKLPLLVFRPYSTSNISPFLKVCYQLDLPVITRCGGTGLAGGCVSAREGVLVLTGHLRKIKDYHHKIGTLCIEPGVTVRELNRWVAADGWYFPLSMMSEGVAGIAGCLSSHARGYHQQQQALFDVIQHVQLVDGQGQILDVPAPLVCGAEGLWGIILEMKIQLKKLPSRKEEFFYLGSWEIVLSQLPLLRSLRSLAFISWHRNHFYLGLEGESWRFPASIAYLTKSLPGIQPIEAQLKEHQRHFFSSSQLFVMISSVFQSNQLPQASAWSAEQAASLQLKCLQEADVLAGSLHLILQPNSGEEYFTQKIQKFLVLWANFVDSQKGSLASCHGVGMQMSPYMPPFWSEESQQAWRRLQRCFDPKQLFSKERFFPALGKSLERQP